MEENSNKMDDNKASYTSLQQEALATEVVIDEYAKVVDACNQMQEKVRELNGLLKDQSEDIHNAIERAELFTKKTRQEAKEKIVQIMSGNSSTSQEQNQEELVPEVVSDNGNTTTKVHQVRSRIKNFLFYLIFVAIISVVYLFTANQNASGPPRNIFGYAPMTVLTKSMHSEIPKDSLIVTKSVDPNTISIGDDITFLLENNSTITHRVIGIHENYEGTGYRGFETQGVDNPRPDENIVFAKNVIGKVIFHNLVIGQILLFIKENIILVGIFGIVTTWLIRSLKSYYAITSKEKKMSLEN